MRDWIKSIFMFNQVGRDEWVAVQAAQVPAGRRVLDVGAGSCPTVRCSINAIIARTILSDCSPISCESIKGTVGSTM